MHDKLRNRCKTNIFLRAMLSCQPAGSHACVCVCVFHHVQIHNTMLRRNKSVYCAVSLLIQFRFLPSLCSLRHIANRFAFSSLSSNLSNVFFFVQLRMNIIINIRRMSESAPNKSCDFQSSEHDPKNSHLYEIDHLLINNQRSPSLRNKLRSITKTT